MGRQMCRSEGPQVLPKALVGWCMWLLAVSHHKDLEAWTAWSCSLILCHIVMAAS